MATITGGPTPASGYSGQKVAITGTGLDTVDFFTIGNVQALVASSPTPSATGVSLVIPSGVPLGATSIRAVTNSAVVSQTGLTVVAADTSDPLVADLQRSWRLEINTGTFASPIWTRVFGILEFQPTIDPTMQDATVYETDGYGGSAKTLLKWGVTAKLLIGKHVSGPRDPGQLAIFALHDQFPGIADIRFYDTTGGPEAYRGYTYVGWSPDSAGADGLKTVSLTLTGNGTRNKVTNPAGS